MVRVRTDAGATLEASLNPEATRALPRTSISFHARGDEFRLEVVAQDTSALRAALNSYLRWASTALKMIEEAKG